MKRRAVLAGVGAAAGGLAGCAGVLGPSCGDEPHDVGMTASEFEPRELTVEVGETVRWLNTSQRAHTVTAYGSQLPEGAAFFASGGYDSTQAAREAWRDQGDETRGGAIYTCDAFEHTFETPGTFPYFCIPHLQAGMVGTIVVEE